MLQIDIINLYDIILQIDSIVDVGVSFYSQQQKLKGTENANVHVNAEEPTQRPVSSKMLYIISQMSRVMTKTNIMLCHRGHF
jgi:hypothetical protein